MTNWKNLFGIAAILFAIGFLLRSVQPAYAIQGPNVSLGTNPIENISGEIVMNSITTTTIWTNNSNHDFIVTTVLMNSGGCYLTVDGKQDGLAQISGFTTITSHHPSNAFLQGKAKLKVPAGSTIDFNHYNTNWNSCQYYIEGYYVHP